MGWKVGDVELMVCLLVLAVVDRHRRPHPAGLLHEEAPVVGAEEQENCLQASKVKRRQHNTARVQGRPERVAPSAPTLLSNHNTDFYQRRIFLLYTDGELLITGVSGSRWGHFLSEHSPSRSSSRCSATPVPGRGSSSEIRTSTCIGPSSPSTLECVVLYKINY